MTTINEIKVERKYNIGNYEMISVSIGYTFPADITSDQAVTEVQGKLKKDLEALKQASR